jgi:hypothetical protein
MINDKYLMYFNLQRHDEPTFFVPKYVSSRRMFQLLYLQYLTNQTVKIKKSMKYKLDLRKPENNPMEKNHLYHDSHPLLFHLQHDKHY